MHDNDGSNCRQLKTQRRYMNVKPRHSPGFSCSLFLLLHFLN